MTTNSTTDDPRQAARAIGRSTTRQLAEVQRRFGINRATLSALPDALSVVAPRGTPLSRDDFWAKVAEPRRELFARSVAQCLSGATTEVVDVIVQHNREDPPLTPQSDIVDAFVGSIQLPFEAVQVGERWERRLQAHALRLTLRHRITPSAASYRQAQVDIADLSPWCYQDQLLLAFETVERELERHYDSVVADLYALDRRLSTRP